jgi:hypothetical protein
MYGRISVLVNFDVRDFDLYLSEIFQAGASTFRQWFRQIGMKISKWCIGSFKSPALSAQSNSVCQEVSVTAFLLYELRPFCIQSMYFMLHIVSVSYKT